MNTPLATGSPFWILSIDGGGFRGVYPAHILARMEEEWSIKWTKTFHMIAGTSTGSILAAGLASGMTAKQLLEFFKEMGREIFKKRWPLSCGLFASQYRNTALKKGLQNAFGDKRLGDVTLPLIIPTTDVGNGCVHVIKSSYDPGFVRDKQVFLWEAVLASCSAPTFFDPYKVSEFRLADGGLWANNPALVAAIDAKRRLGIPLDQLRILSIGTGTGRQFYPFRANRLARWFGWGFLTRWRRKRFIDMLLNLQSETATNVVRLLLGNHQFLRVNFNSDRPLALDDPHDFDDLMSKAAHDFTHESDRIRQFLFHDKEANHGQRG